MSDNEDGDAAAPEAEPAGADADERDEETDLVARAAEFDDDLATAVEELTERADALDAEVDALDAERDDLESRLKRAHADFQNYKKRSREREEELRERATEDLVERLLDVRDNLVRALQQDADAEVRDGVEATLATFDRVLDAENVAAIEPAPGDEVDPRRHEVVLKVDSDRPAGAIDELYRPGYEMADKVLRPAQVTVSEASDAGEE